MKSLLEKAWHEIDADPNNNLNAQIRALTVRYLIEQSSTDVLRRFAPRMDPKTIATAVTESGSQTYRPLGPGRMSLQISCEPC
jgi:predicted P-loop ATPase